MRLERDVSLLGARIPGVHNIVVYSFDLAVVVVVVVVVFFSVRSFYYFVNNA